MDISQNHLHLLKYSQLDTVKLLLGATEGDSGPVVLCNDGGRKQALEPETRMWTSRLCPLVAVHFLSFSSLEQTEHIYAYLGDLF